MSTWSPGIMSFIGEGSVVVFNCGSMIIITGAGLKKLKMDDLVFTGLMFEMFTFLWEKRPGVTAFWPLGSGFDGTREEDT